MFLKSWKTTNWHFQMLSNRRLCSKQDFFSIHNHPPHAALSQTLPIVYLPQILQVWVRSDKTMNNLLPFSCGQLIPSSEDQLIDFTSISRSNVFSVLKLRVWNYIYTPLKHEVMGKWLKVSRDSDQPGNYFHCLYVKMDTD